jgi:hypothetical protein
MGSTPPLPITTSFPSAASLLERSTNSRNSSTPVFFLEPMIDASQYGLCLLSRTPVGPSRSIMMNGGYFKSKSK